MNPAFLIARKDLRAYFTRPMAYIVVASFLFVVGFIFGSLFLYFIASSQHFSQFGGSQKASLTEMVLHPLFGNINVVFLCVAPFITVRLLAEERRDHSLELLLTAPLRSLHIVLGKFLAGLGMLLVMAVATLVYPLVLQAVAHPDWGVIFTSYLGLIFVSSTYVAIGLFWSSRTESQVVAAMLSFGTMLFFWLISWASHSAGPILSEVLNHLSLIGHYTSFSQGILDTTDIVFYLTFSGFVLFLTNLSLDAQ